MNLKHLSDEALLKQTRSEVARETDAMLSVLHHIREVERRQLFLKDHGTLFNWVLSLGYDKGGAHMRIAAMELMRDLPDAEEKVEDGSLNLTLMTQAQNFIRKEKIQDVEEKREVLESIVGQSTRDAHRTLMGQTDTPEKHMPERVKPVSRTHSEIRLVVDDELLEQIKQLQSLLAAKDLKETIAKAVQGEIKRRTPKPPSSAKNHATQQSLAEIKRIVWHRDQGKCTYCGATYGLEYDHIIPKAKGGLDTAENLRLRCRSHNRMEAIQAFGHKKIAQYVPAMN